MEVAGAHVHDTTLFFETLLDIAIKRPKPTKKNKQNLCADKANDSAENRMIADMLDYINHIKSRREERTLQKNKAENLLQCYILHLLTSRYMQQRIWDRLLV